MTHLAHIQAALRAAAPRPAPGATPVRQFRCALGKHWDMFTDTETGRNYYHNVATGDSTWRPPRGLRAHDAPAPPPAVPAKPPPSPARGVRRWGALWGWHM